MPIIMLLMLALGGAIFVARSIAKNNALQAIVENELLIQSRRGARHVRLHPLGQEDLQFAYHISRTVEADKNFTGVQSWKNRRNHKPRHIFRVEVPGMIKLHDRNGDQVHLYASAGPGDDRGIHACVLNGREEVRSHRVLTLWSYLQNPRLFMLRRSIIRSVNSAENRRFVTWMDEARERAPSPWILKHVVAWARSAKKGTRSNLEINADTNLDRFSHQTGACGPAEVLFSLERYLGHATDGDLEIYDKLLTFSDVALAIEFFGGKTSRPKPESTG